MSQPETNFSKGDGEQDRARKADSPTVIPAIQLLKAGNLSPRSIPKPTRRLCIREFLDDGMSVPEIAMILKCHERTVFRDLDAIRKQNAIGPGDLKFGECLGDLLRTLRVCHGKARRAARDKNATPEDKIEAERLVAETSLKLMAFLTKMGFVASPRLLPRITLDAVELPNEETNNDRPLLGE